MSRAEDLARTLRRAAELDREWIGKIPSDDKRCTPWMPFPMDAFIAMTAEALPETEGERFLEIGCGVGSKLLVARDLFGLDAAGFDRVAAYVAVARQLGLKAEQADATVWPGYGRADLIWFNRVFADAQAQADLERQVFAQAAAGTVVMCANLAGKPPRSWYMIMEDDDLRRGIWQKPDAAWR